MAYQREFPRKYAKGKKFVVIEGRDIGTEIFPFLVNSNRIFISSSSNLSNDEKPSHYLINIDFIKEVRGKGLWIGVEFNKTISAKKICLSLMDEGILAKETHETVIRFAPPLMIQKSEIEWALEKIDSVFKDIKI